MTESDSVRQTCSNCDEELELNSKELCPKCENTESKIITVNNEGLNISENSCGLKTTQWYEKNPKLAWVYLVTSILVPVMTFLVVDPTIGLAVGIISSISISFLLPSIRTKMIGRERI